LYTLKYKYKPVATGNPGAHKFLVYAWLKNMYQLFKAERVLQCNAGWSNSITVEKNHYIPI